MKKRILSLVLALCLALSLAPAAFAANIVDSGTCGADADGSNIAWTLDADGNLTVTGAGLLPLVLRGADAAPVALCRHGFEVFGKPFGRDLRLILRRHEHIVHAEAYRDNVRLAGGYKGIQACERGFGVHAAEACVEATHSAAFGSRFAPVAQRGYAVAEGYEQPALRFRLLRGAFGAGRGGGALRAFRGGG